MSKSNTALLIVDMQNDFVLPGASACIAGAQKSVPNIVKVLGHFRQRKYPVFHVIRNYRADGSDVEKFRLEGFLNKKGYVVPNTKGSDIIDELKPLENEYTIIKNRFSGFMNTELDYMLRRLNIENIVVTGTQYPNCIRATIFDAVSLGYDVTLVTDAASAETEEIARANIIDIQNIGVTCVTTNEFVTG